MKRACPYDANLLRSSKQHLMDYDIDENARAKIIDETMKKLRDGAMKANQCVYLAPPSPELRIEDAYGKNSKQILLSSYFKITGTGLQTVDSAKIMPMMKRPSEYLPCSFCEKSIETSQCVRCRENFCSGCSITSYQGCDEVIICFSCS